MLGGVPGRSLRREWPIVATTYWCIDLNVPLLGRECPGGGEAIKLKLAEPGDARPLFEHDLEFIKRAYKRETGSTAGFSEFLGVGVKLLNKVPFMDLMYEVVSEASIVGRVYWDPAEGDWRVRFSYWGLLRVWHREPLPKLKIRGGLRTLRRVRVFGNNLGLPPRSQVVYVDEEDRPIGIGYVVDDGGVIKTHSVFKPLNSEELSQSKPRNSTWSDVVKANDYYIYYYKSRALKFIHVMAEKVRKPIIVSFSGGKDSLVALHLTLEAGYKPAIVFNDTGIEMPETYEFIEEIVKKWELDLLVASAGDLFWRAVEKLGPPGKDFRWCCKVVKLAPLARLLIERFPDGALNIVGQRAFESLDRAWSPRVWRNKWIPHILSISPIQDWSQLAIWLYIWRHKLPYNPLYERGFDRIGCFMCPAAFNAEYEFVKSEHPELWSKWERVLVRWAHRIGLRGGVARLWVKLGLWRWLTPAAQKERLAKRLGVTLPSWRDVYKKWLNPSLEAYRASEVGVSIRLTSDVDTQWLLDQYSVLGSFKLVEPPKASKLLLEGPRGVRVEVDRRGITVRGASGVLARELAFDAFKLLYRWVHCAGCRVCEVSCPTGAIKVEELDGLFRPRVEAKKCIHCKLCIDNCPVADVVVERVFAPLALGEPTAWRRSGKRTHESVVRRYLRLKGFNVEAEDRRGVVTYLESDALTSPSLMEAPES